MNIWTFRTYCRNQEQRIRRLLDQYGRQVRPSTTANTHIYSRRPPQDLEDYLTTILQNRPTTRGTGNISRRRRRA